MSPFESPFELGRVVVTPGALERFGVAEICSLLDRHVLGDWGELDPRDVRENERALRFGGRIFSFYRTHEGKAWIITEADRSATCVLLPDEY